MRRIVWTTRQINRRTAARDAFNANGALTVLKPLAGHQAIGEFQRTGAGRAAGAGNAFERNFLRLRQSRQQKHHETERHQTGINKIAADKIGVGRRPRQRELLGARPGLVPLRAFRNVERQQQGQPRAKTANAFRYGAACLFLANETRGFFIKRVAADEGQIDERSDAQTHMIEPDQDAQRIIGEHRHENIDAPAPELAFRQDVIHP